MEWKSWLEKGKKVQLTIAGWNEEDVDKKKLQKEIDNEKREDPMLYDHKTASWESWLEKNNAIETSHKDEKEKEEWDGKFSSSTIEDEVKDDKDDKAVSEEEPLDELTDGKLEEIEKLKSWEAWLDKDAQDGKQSKDGLPKADADQEVIDEFNRNTRRHEKSPTLNSDYKDTMDKVKRGLKTMRGKVEVSNKLEASKYKRPKFTKDDVFLFGKKKSWEAWLEKDALDGKGGNEAKDDLMMPSFMGMYKKPTKQTKEGQARDYLRDTPHVESYHSRRLGHGEKYESGKRPLEKNPQSGGFVNGTRKEEWDITADQDAQQRGSGRNTFDDKDDNEPSGGFIQGQGRTVPKTGIAPNIKPQGKGVKHKGRPRGSKNKAWEAWLEKGRWDKPKTTAVDNHLKEESGRDTRVEVNELNAEIGQEATNERLDEAGRTGMFKPTDTPNFTTKKPKYVKGVEQTGDDISQSKEHLNIDIAHENKSWEGWLEKMQGAGDARFGNQHLTGLDQKPVDNEEDEANILPEKDVNTDEKDEKQEETEDKDDKDNKPYKALSHE